MFDLTLLRRVPSRLDRCELGSPVGRIVLLASERGLCAVVFDSEAREVERELAGIAASASNPILQAAEMQLAEYFSHRRTSFELPLDLHGTEFQKRVWTRLLAIPYGRTRSYGEIASELGGRGLSRAVGLANASNPVPIVVPCHRVIGAKGTLVGFGGGLAAKQYLLAHEAAMCWDLPEAARASTC